MRNTKQFLAIITLLFSGYVSPVLADQHQPMLDKNKFSIGAGISNNSISGPASDETGFQFFGAYDLDQVNLMEGVTSSVEFGFMDYGFSGDSTGIWGTYVIDGKFSGQFGWLARLGLDIGDDNGLMLGAGVGFDLSDKLILRGEYVIRDQVDSLQINFLYRM
jgi:opacity protein-like surface antigen